MTTFSAWYTGAVCHFIYPLYPQLARRCLPAALTGSTLAVGLGCTMLDNFIHSPFFYIPSFFLYTDMVQGATLSQAAHHLWNDWMPVVQSCLVLWLPLQLINFTVIPPARRVVFINAVCVVWNVVIDHLAHRKLHESHQSIKQTIKKSNMTSESIPGIDRRHGTAHEATDAGSDIHTIISEQEAIQPRDQLIRLATQLQSFS